MAAMLRIPVGRPSAGTAGSGRPRPRTHVGHNRTVTEVGSGGAQRGHLTAGAGQAQAFGDVSFSALHRVILPHMHRLFAYVADNDLGAVESVLVAEFERFTGSWNVPGVRLRNVKAPLSCTPEGQMPDWNLGLSVEVGGLELQKLELLVSFLAAAARQSGKTFVIGTWSPQTSATEDLCVVDSTASVEMAHTLFERLNNHPWSTLPGR